MTFEKLIENVGTYIKKEADLKRIKEAFELASFKHGTQLEKSGAPYISPPPSSCLYII